VSLASKLASRPPRETSGPRSANRFDYQKDWIILHLLELHKSGEDYVIICDYHEDVIVINDETSNVGKFYQVKTLTDDTWTLSKLIKRKKGNSILGKLYQNYILAADDVCSLHLVSNAHYDLTMANGESSKPLSNIQCSELLDSESKTIADSLAEECKCTCLIPSKPILCFEVTALSVTDHAGHTKGKIAEFLQVFLPRAAHPVIPVYQTLFDEIRRKTNHEGTFTTTTSGDFIRQKSLGRSDVTKLLAHVLAAKDLDETWKCVREQLSFERFPPFVIKSIGNMWQRYQVERQDLTNLKLQHLRKRVQELCMAALKDANLDFKQLFSLILPQLKTDEFGDYHTEDYLCAIILMEAYEIPELPQIGTKPEKEA